jgi:hypothetical protein
MELLSWDWKKKLFAQFTVTATLPVRASSINHRPTTSHQPPTARAQFQAALRRSSITISNRPGAGAASTCVVLASSLHLLGFTAENLHVSLGDKDGAVTTIRRVLV